MRLVLASSPAADSPEAMSLGALCVAAAIRSSPGLAGLEVALVEGGPPRPRGPGVAEAAAAASAEGAELASRIASSAPDLVGLSVYSWNRAAMAAAARELRKARPGAAIFAGGPEATADPPSLIEEAGLDFAIVGEGESAACAALAALLEAAPRGPLERGLELSPAIAEALSRVPGVALPGTLRVGPGRRAPDEDCASLVSPWLSGVADPAARGGDIVWELARGCPFKCAYCYESKGRSGLRPFPTKRIEAELELFERAGVSYAFVLDPTFDADRDRAASLLDLLRAKAPNIRWKFEVRAELLDRALVKRFAQLDCSLQIGLQSARPETLELVGRPGFDRRQFARKAAMLSEAGVTFGLDLIYGLPGDGLRQFEDSLDFALALDPNHLDIFPLALLPGTELADRAAELGIEADPRPPYLVRSTRQMPPGDLAAAAALAEACDRFYTAGRAVGWFAAALAPLRARPSAFLRGYAETLARGAGAGGGRAPRGAAPAARPREEGSRAIEAEQLAFLERSYSGARLGRLLPALRDLVRLHGAWARALAEGEETELELSYEPEEALGAALSLEAFAELSRPAPSRVVVVPDDEEGARIESADAARPRADTSPRRRRGSPRADPPAR
jgi:hypothetical protein